MRASSFLSAYTRLATLFLVLVLTAHLTQQQQQQQQQQNRRSQTTHTQASTASNANNQALRSSAQLRAASNPQSTLPASTAATLRQQKQQQESNNRNNKDKDDESADASSDKKFECPRPDGLFADPNTCKKFILCGSGHPWYQDCPPGLFFDSKLKFCTFKTSSLTCGPGGDEEESKQDEAVQEAQDSLPHCDQATCLLPDCFCSSDGTQIPANLPQNQVPQMILLTFSGAVNELVLDHYKKILGYPSGGSGGANKYGGNSLHQTRVNPNGCGIKATFFVTHEYTNYAQIHWLAAQGHELSLHSISHRLPELWWTERANYSEWVEEIIGMREILLQLTNINGDTPVIKREDIVGMRAPYIKPAGEPMYQMINDFGLTYDTSIVAPKLEYPLWPFTLDSRMPFDCASSSRNRNPNKDTTSHSAASSSGRGGGSRGASHASRGFEEEEEVKSNNYKVIRNTRAAAMMNDDDDDDEDGGDWVAMKDRPRNQQPESYHQQQLLEVSSTTTTTTSSPLSLQQTKRSTKVRAKRQSPFIGKSLKCATKSYPGVWEVPINPMSNEFNTCHLLDQCVFPSQDDNNDSSEIVQFLIDNFQRHYNTTRAPFQINIHVQWVLNPNRVRALTKFIDHIQKHYPDAWFVTFKQMIEWMKQPVASNLAPQLFKCDDGNKVKLTSCNRPQTCVVKLNTDSENSATTHELAKKTDIRYLQICPGIQCPKVFPWFGNLLGSERNFKTVLQLVQESAPPSTTTPSPPSSSITPAASIPSIPSRAPIAPVSSQQQQQQQQQTNSRQPPKK